MIPSFDPSGIIISIEVFSSTKGFFALSDIIRKEDHWKGRDPWESLASFLSSF
jgi:hypothetical protein